LPHPVPNKYAPRPTTFQTIKARIEYNIRQYCAVYIIFLAFIVPSALITGMAAYKTFLSSTPSSNDTTLPNVSQGLNSLLGIFCILVPLIQRNKDLQPDLPIQAPTIFTWLVMTSATAVLGMCIAPVQDGAALLLGFASSATQLAATLQLILGSTEAITSEKGSVAVLETQRQLVDATQRQAALE
jgi:hypothetical protein